MFRLGPGLTRRRFIRLSGITRFRRIFRLIQIIPTRGIIPIRRVIRLRLKIRPRGIRLLIPLRRPIRLRNVQLSSKSQALITQHLMLLLNTFAAKKCGDTEKRTANVYMSLTLGVLQTRQPLFTLTPAVSLFSFTSVTFFDKNLLKLTYQRVYQILLYGHDLLLRLRTAVSSRLGVFCAASQLTDALKRLQHRKSYCRLTVVTVLGLDFVAIVLSDLSLLQRLECSFYKFAVRIGLLQQTIT